MRGGSIPVLIWACLLLVLFAANWIYQGDIVQFAQSAAAVIVIVLFALAGAAFGRGALRRGPPPQASTVEGVSEVSFGAAGVGFGLATLVFGIVWGHFLIYFGAGLMVFSLGRLALELRSERKSVSEHRPPAPLEASLRDESPEVPAPATPGHGGRRAQR